MSTGGQLLLVSVGPYTLAMDASEVRAVSQIGTSPSQLARQALGVEGAAPHKSRLLMVNTQPPRPLLVDAVQGLRDVSAVAVQRLPLLMQGNPRTPWLLGLGECDGSLLLLVDAKRLEGGAP